MGVNFDEYKRRLENYRNQRDIEFNEFLIDYAERVPPPKPKKKIDKKEVKLSIKFWLAIIAGVCAVGASGLRVYDRMFQVASLSGANFWIAVLESVFALGAVNIGLVALSFVLAYQKKKVSDWSLLIGVFVAAIISLVTGLGQSFSGLRMDNVMQVFDWVLAISLAGITALEWVSGDMAGVELVNYEMKNEKAQADYEKDVQAENERFEREDKEWRAGARRSIGLWKAGFTDWVKQNYEDADEPEKEELKVEKSSESNKENPFSNLSKREQAYQLVKKFVTDKKRIPSTKDIAEQGYSVGLVSGAINRFIVENGDTLLKQGLVTEEKLVKAKQAVEK